MSKEVKIALFTLVAIGIGVWGFKYLMGNNILDNSLVVYSKYKEIDGIRRSTPVLFKGYQIGLVSDIYPEDETYDKIVVKMSIDEDINIAKDAVMQITTTSLMGDKAVVLLNNDKPCTLTNNCVESGEFLTGATRGLLSSMLGTDDLSEYMKVLSQELKGLFQTLNDEMEQGGNKIGNALNDFSEAMANTKSATDQIDKILAASSGDINGMISNLKKITDTIAVSSNEIKLVISNAESFTSDLKDANINETVNAAKNTMQKLESTLANADKMLAETKELVNELQNGDGAIAKFINDPEFASRLQLAILDIDLLLQDLRLHPERYRRILSKKTQDYELPSAAEDPSRNLPEVKD